MDREIRGACRFCVLLDMKNTDIFDKLQEMYGKDVSHTPGYVSGPKPFAMVAHHLPMILDQENLRFQIESNASMSR
jgi:hypothetical protein